MDKLVVLFKRRLTPRSDFDPEDLERAGPDSDDEGAEAADPNAGREHYQAVG
jgi:protein AATF/BFR2